MTPPQAFALALQQHRAGRLAEAETLYRQILAVQPYHSDALHQMGEMARQMGNNQSAVELIKRAISINPFQAPFFVTLGIALAALGQPDGAIAAFRIALRLNPGSPELHNNLGNALRERGNLDEAIASCRRALELKPGFPEAQLNLGAALAAQGRLDEAIAAYRRALQIRPDLPEAHNNLANALRERGDFAEAVAACRRALQLKPDFLEAHNNLGVALAAQGELDEAVAAYRHGLQLRPDMPEIHNNLASALKEGGNLDEAIAAGRRALELRPGFPEAYNNLGNALRERGDLDEAVAAYRDAIERKPGYAQAHANLGTALVDRGQLDEAITAYRRALELNPANAGWHSNLILALHLHPAQTPEAISEEHHRWNRQFSDPLKPSLQPHANDPDPDRRLRIGYVSSDFRYHPVGRFVLPLFERHDGEHFEILCYSGTARADWMTDRLRALAGQWRETAGVPDDRLAAMIREDEVDILVDLSLHTAGNRLPVFARQPAPVQVAWLGYPGSTGLPGIGYRLTDARMEPPGEGSAWSSEECIRLPDCWCCYQPPAECPEINALPASSAKGVTFGSLNNFAKMHEGVLILWARILKAVKRSRLLMSCPEGEAQERVRAFFKARRIAQDRVELAGVVSPSEYQALYHRIDIGLDPFPYNGMTTTCDALWMGVPVLTFPGETPASRASLSLLSAIGLPELAASGEDDYLRAATSLATDLPRLANLRATLRARMLASPLMDAPRFAKNVEAAYRSIWQRYGKG